MNITAWALQPGFLGSVNVLLWAREEAIPTHLPTPSLCVFHQGTLQRNSTSLLSDTNTFSHLPLAVKQILKQYLLCTINSNSCLLGCVLPCGHKTVSCSPWLQGAQGGLHPWEGLLYTSQALCPITQRWSYQLSSDVGNLLEGIDFYPLMKPHV